MLFDSESFSFSSYLDSICEEINDKLEEAGQISIADLTKHYDLPGDFMYDVSHNV